MGPKVWIRKTPKLVKPAQTMLRLACFPGSLVRRLTSSLGREERAIQRHPSCPPKMSLLLVAQMSQDDVMSAPVFCSQHEVGRSCYRYCHSLFMFIFPLCVTSVDAGTRSVTIRLKSVTSA